MTYNVFGGTLNLTQSITIGAAARVLDHVKSNKYCTELIARCTCCFLNEGRREGTGPD